LAHGWGFLGFLCQKLISLIKMLALEADKDEDDGAQLEVVGAKKLQVQSSSFRRGTWHT